MVANGKYRIEVLKKLQRNPSLPSELAKEFKIHRSSIARVLNDLVKELLISKTTRNAKTTTYFLTKSGERVTHEIKEVKI